jgi:hypothetical protein
VNGSLLCKLSTKPTTFTDSLSVLASVLAIAALFLVVVYSFAILFLINHRK